MSTGDEHLLIDNGQEKSEEGPPAPDRELWVPGEEHRKSSAAPSSYQLSKYQSTCMFIITASIVLYGLYSTRAIAFPIVLAFLLALPLRPVVRVFRRVGLPEAIGALLIVCIVFSAIVSAGVIIWPPATQWLASAPKDLRVVERKLRSLEGPITEMKEAGESVDKLTESSSDPTTLKVEVKQPGLTSSMMNTTGVIAIGGTITVSLLYLLLAFGDRLLDGAVKAWPTKGDRDNIRKITIEAERTISHYLLTYTLINVGLGVVIGLGLWLIGMPNALLWGVMACCLNYIPFVGLVAGTVIVFLVGVLSFDSIAFATLAPAIYLGANGIEANVITPLLLGRSLKLNVVVIFLFIVIWGWMWGIGGALIAVPLLIVLKVICDHVGRMRPLALLLGS